MNSNFEICSNKMMLYWSVLFICARSWNFGTSLFGAFLFENFLCVCLALLQFSEILVLGALFSRYSKISGVLVVLGNLARLKFW